MPDRTFAAYVVWTLLVVDLSAIQEGKLKQIASAFEKMRHV